MEATAMKPPTARAVPFDDLAGSVRQSLYELTRISGAMDSGVPPGEPVAMQLVTLAAELREAAAAITSGPAQHGDGTDTVRGFLRAVRDALEIPRPAGPDDERAYLRARALRADEVCRAARNIMESAPDATGRNWSWSAAWLRTAASDHSVTGYQHAAGDMPEMIA
jgi:hypothetical protein